MCLMYQIAVQGSRTLKKISEIYENDDASRSCSGVDVTANIDNNRIKTSIRDTRS